MTQKRDYPTVLSNYIASGTLTLTAVMIIKHPYLQRIAAGTEIGLRSTIKGEHRVQ